MQVADLQAKFAASSSSMGSHPLEQASRPGEPPGPNAES